MTPWLFLRQAADLIQNPELARQIRSTALELENAAKTGDTKNESVSTDLRMTKDHVHLAYWTGRTLVNGSLSVLDWQKLVFRVCGQQRRVTEMTQAECRSILTLGCTEDDTTPYARMH